MDRQCDGRRPQGTTWTTITPQTPTFNPTKFTPANEQTTWKPSFPVPAKNESQDSNVILGSVKQDPSGGFVHTFGAPTKPSTPQAASSSSTQNSTWQNFNNAPPRQDSVNSPRYIQEIIVPSDPINQRISSPVRQTSYQGNPSQFSPVQQSSQRSSPGVYFQPQNNGYDNRPNGNSGPVYQTVRQATISQPINRQDSIPYQTVRQNSSPYQTARQEFNPYQPQRQDSSANSWNGPSSPYQTARQDSWSQPVSQNLQRQDSWNQAVNQNSPRQDPWSQTVNQNLPRQDSRNQPINTNPVRQESWSNQPNQQNSYHPPRQDSWSNVSLNQTSPSYPPSTPDSWSNPPSRPQSIPYQPPSPSVAPGLFSKQPSVSPSSPESAVRYDPVPQSSTPGLQRQSSVQYQQSPKPFTPTGYSPVESQSNSDSCVPQSASSPYSYGVPGPFVSQQPSSGGSQPWSPGHADSFPTPPPFSPSIEAAGVPWPTSSGLPTPPPPPPAPPVSEPAPFAAPPPPPPPPPPPMPSSGGMKQDVPAWKKQIQATKEAKAAAGVTAQTPGTPCQELPAALVNSMKKDKKPFTYLPGGLDLSEIRSPKMQRRIMANQQHAPPPPSAMGHQVQLQPRQNSSGPQQVQNQMERLNLAEGPQGDRMAAVDTQRQASTDGSANPGQSRSFRILQMMTGGEDETDSVEQQPSPAKREEEEMRFTGVRRQDNPIPSRAFHALQKMTQGAEDNANQQTDPRFGNETSDDVRQEDGPVDIRYKGGYIPGRSFKMLQEMTGMNEDGSGGTVVPSVLQEKRQQRKPNLHLNINQPPPAPKQFPQPSVPASQQTAEEAPKMYRGGRIPSQSFRMLQAMTGESTDSQGEDGTDM